jgi:hypothetical protein
MNQKTEKTKNPVNGRITIIYEQFEIRQHISLFLNSNNPGFVVV